MKLEFKWDLEDARIIEVALKRLYDSTEISSKKKKIKRIHQEIETDLRQNNVIYKKLVQILRNYTSSPILHESNLVFALGISRPYLKHSLFKDCNRIAREISPKSKRIHKSDTSSVETVQDIIDLIKDSLE